LTCSSDKLEDKLLDLGQLILHEKQFREQMQNSPLENVRQRALELLHGRQTESTEANKVSKSHRFLWTRSLVYVLFKIFQILFFMWFGAITFHFVDHMLFPDSMFEE
jgi:hypothetical protein